MTKTCYNDKAVFGELQQFTIAERKETAKKERAAHEEFCVEGANLHKRLDG